MRPIVPWCALAVAALALAPRASAQSATLTRETLDRFVAGWEAANAESERIYGGDEGVDLVEQERQADAWQECKDEVEGEAATPWVGEFRRYQAAMQAYGDDTRNPKYLALSDSATRLMLRIEAAAEPAVAEKCGTHPEQARQEEFARMETEGADFNFNDYAAERAGMDWQVFARLQEKILLFLEAERPAPNDLWSAAELKLLEANRDRLAELMS